MTLQELFVEDSTAYQGASSHTAAAISGNNSDPYYKLPKTKENIQKYYQRCLSRGANPAQAKMKTQEYFSL